MKDDYLWDRTGEPDPEIQQLEQVLGTLRYQPQPLELPAQVRIGRPRTFLPRVAIAAAVATILAGAALWLVLHRQSAPIVPESASNRTVEKIIPEPEKVAPLTNDSLANSPKSESLKYKPKGRGVHKNVTARNKQSRPLRDAEFTARDRVQAEAVKEQLLLALRVASSKLSLAQKKAQGGYPGNLIRNQHKVG